ncbi:MAG: hypothetical protein NTW96_24560 [Planctomycetia bacterium]|nr:hypothetical protein [Planctomycetia bacterium]
MASLSKDGDGWRITFDDPETKRRRTIRLKTPKRAAESIKARVEAMVS